MNRLHILTRARLAHLSRTGHVPKHLPAVFLKDTADMRYDTAMEFQHLYPDATIEQNVELADRFLAKLWGPLEPEVVPVKSKVTPIKRLSRTVRPEVELEWEKDP